MNVRKVLKSFCVLLGLWPAAMFAAMAGCACFPLNDNLFHLLNFLVAPFGVVLVLVVPVSLIAVAWQLLAWTVAPFRVVRLVKFAKPVPHAGKAGVWDEWFDGS